MADNSAARSITTQHRRSYSMGRFYSADAQYTASAAKTGEIRIVETEQAERTLSAQPARQPQREPGRQPQPVRRPPIAKPAPGSAPSTVREQAKGASRLNLQQLILKLRPVAVMLVAVCILAAAILPGAFMSLNNRSLQKDIARVQRDIQSGKDQYSVLQVQKDNLISDDQIRAFAQDNGLISMENYKVRHVETAIRSGVVRSGNRSYQDDSLFDRIAGFFAGLSGN